MKEIRNIRNELSKQVGETPYYTVAITLEKDTVIRLINYLDQQQERDREKNNLILYLSI